MVFTSQLVVFAIEYLFEVCNDLTWFSDDFDKIDLDYRWDLCTAASSILANNNANVITCYAFDDSL